HRVLHPFPTRRSSDLVSCIAEGVSGSTNAVNISMTGSLPDVSAAGLLITLAATPTAGTYGPANVADSGGTVALKNTNAKWVESQDRKSTRLNSSHVKI